MTAPVVAYECIRHLTPTSDEAFLSYNPSGEPGLYEGLVYATDHEEVVVTMQDTLDELQRKIDQMDEILRENGVRMG